MGALTGHTCNARLIMLPGMGVDERLFQPQRRVFPNLEVPPWIEPRPRESLGDYAHRWAGTVDPSPPFYLGGVSFGGMVAYLAARHVKPQALFLVASCRSGRAIPPRFALCEPVSRLLPDWLLRCLRAPAANLVAWRAACDCRNARLLHDIAVDCSIPFQRWAGRAMVEWASDGEPPQPDVPVYQIHGGRDRLIPLIPGEPTHVIPTGGHLINLTHADEVNAFIIERIRSLEAQSGTA
jgi:pimeloyl-ACP methyl ester carboxylesterase